MNNTALKKVRELLGGDTFPNCQSASLRLEKFVRIGDNTKKAEIDAVVSKSRQKIPRPLPKGGGSFTAALGGRLIVNQAGGVLENAGLCLHPHFNAPYIPGSAVKGCARHAAWQVWDEAEEGEKKLAVAKEIAEIFGFPTGDSKPKDPEKVEPGRCYLDDYLIQHGIYKATDAVGGTIAFLDAVPETTAKLVCDLVNCHHKDYYAGKQPDAIDNESPVPNFFPAVEAGARFVFSVVSVRRGDNRLLARAQELLIRAITENGIGAKTAAGYGWFSYDAEAEKQKAEQRAADEQARLIAVAKAEADDAERRRLEALRSERAKLPLLEQWANGGGAAAVCGKEGKAFALKWSTATDDQKNEVTRSLQEAKGLGFEVWAMLRTDKKRKNQTMVSAVFKWCKEHELGKMPQ